MRPFLSGSRGRHSGNALEHILRQNGASAVQGPATGSGTKLSEEGNGTDEKSIILTLTSPADFIVDPDGTKNTKQAPHEIGVRSAAKHLQSIEHFKAVKRLENAKRKQKRLENERQDESAASGIQDFTFTHEHIHSPIPSGSLSSSLPSAAEVEMWARYEANGANFDAGNNAGNNAADVNVHHAQLQKQAEVFSLLDAEGVAKALGFGGNDVMKELLAKDDEEDFLSGIMANIGTGQLRKSASELRQGDKTPDTDQKCQSGILQLPSSENSFCTSRPTANSEIANCFTLGSIAGQFLEDVICMGDRAFQGSAPVTARGNGILSSSPGAMSQGWRNLFTPGRHQVD
ncbi:hypothetical protein B0H14DRAFT_2630140 [Mycena olivaceomarginata]|nr:hypothetical protein B0H14DRAFT_2630140 [Mycena olivaceomarginata]